MQCYLCFSQPLGTIISDCRIACSFFKSRYLAQMLRSSRYLLHSSLRDKQRRQRGD